MRKIFKLTVVTLIAALFSGCSAASSGKDEQMDFQAKIEWKVPDPAVNSRPKILFVGNSHTFYNNLTGVFVNIVNAQNQKSDVYELSQGYYTLKKFADMEDKAGAKLNKVLTEQNWDFVILQENTKMALPASAEDEMFPYARILDEKVKAAGGQTAFLMTWAPKDGINKYKCEDVQSQLASSYMTIANELDGLLIPAGIGFMRCADLYPEIELWDNDGQHPSPAGTYLAACTAYAVVFQESPESCPYIADLDQELASKLQKVAAEMILD